MRKSMSLLLALALMLSLASFAPASVAEDEVITLTMLQRLPASYVVEDNPVIEAWGEMMGVKIEIEAPPISNFNDRRNVIMASGDLPDLIYVGDTGTLYKQWSAEGLFLQLDDYFTPETMPNATAVLTEEELFYTRIGALDDGLYSLPRVQTKPWDCIVYRQDWLDALGLEIPTTAAEFAEVMLAFTTQDPDGNGKDDTYGWSLNVENSPEFRSIVSAWGLHPSEVPEVDGSYVLFQAQENYMEYMRWLRDMYANGSMDPEFYTTKMYEDDDNYKAGKFGAVYNSKIIEHLITIGADETFLNANPGAKLVAGPPLMAEGETVANVYYSPQVWGNYAINADSKYIDKAIYVLDQGYTDAVNELLMFGVEGITYTDFDSELRFATKTEEQKQNATMYCASYATINYQRADKGLLIANGSTQEEVDFFMSEYNKIGPYTNRVTFLNGSSLPGYSDADLDLENSGIKDEFKALRVKYICGQITEEEYTTFLNDKYIPAYQTILDVYAANDLNQ